MNSMIDLSEFIKRLIKYLVEGLMVAIAAFAIPKRSLNLEEIAFIALTAAATFSILDTYIPSMGVTARSGAGFGIGANLVGFPGGM
jgi:ABC-type Co2+ transport system permease subunit